MSHSRHWLICCSSHTSSPRKSSSSFTSSSFSTHLPTTATQSLISFRRNTWKSSSRYLLVLCILTQFGLFAISLLRCLNKLLLWPRLITRSLLYAPDFGSEWLPKFSGDFLVPSYICDKIFMKIRSLFPEKWAKLWENAPISQCWRIL